MPKNNIKMKAAFLFPFYRTKSTQYDGLPLSTPSLAGTILKHKPDIKIEQIDLSQEAEIFSSESEANKNKLDRAISLVEAAIGKQGKMMTPNRLNQDIKLPTTEDQKKLSSFISEFDKYLGLKSFDHFFLTVYQIYDGDIYAMLALAFYLKNRYPNKKIIIGGMRGISKNVELLIPAGFFDAIVYGMGNTSIIRLLEDLSNDDLHSVYKDPVSASEVLIRPDYSSFRHLNSFKVNDDTVLKNVGINSGNHKNTERLFLPYKFSSGCFWSKCKYCNNSAFKKNECHLKKIDEIIDDIKILKKETGAGNFIFYNNNFNSDLDWTKKLLKKMIDEELNVYWTDSFNLKNIDQEMVDLLKRAGCIRVDIGLVTFDPVLQSFYENIIQENRYLDNLKILSNSGIWVEINMIANLPFSYSVKNEIKILKDYVEYIDAVTLNSYRAYFSDLLINRDLYGLKIVDETVATRNGKTPMFFLEKEFKGSLSERKKLYAANYNDLYDFFIDQDVVVNYKNYYLLCALKELYGADKEKIRPYMLLGGGQKVE